MLIAGKQRIAFLYSCNILLLLLLLLILVLQHNNHLFKGSCESLSQARKLLMATVMVARRITFIHNQIFNSNDRKLKNKKEGRKGYNEQMSKCSCCGRLL